MCRKIKKYISILVMVVVTTCLYGCDKDEYKNNYDMLNRVDITQSDKAKEYLILDLLDYDYEINNDGIISVTATFKNISGKKIRDCKPILGIDIPFEHMPENEEIKILSVDEYNNYDINEEPTMWAIDEEKTFIAVFSPSNILERAKSVNNEYIKELSQALEIIKNEEFCHSYRYSYYKGLKSIEVQRVSSLGGLNFTEKLFETGII